MEKKDENAGDRAREKDVTWLNARERGGADLQWFPK